MYIPYLPCQRLGRMLSPVLDGKMHTKSFAVSWSKYIIYHYCLLSACYFSISFHLITMIINRYLWKLLVYLINAHLTVSLKLIKKLLREYVVGLLQFLGHNGLLHV